MHGRKQSWWLVFLLSTFLAWNITQFVSDPARHNAVTITDRKEVTHAVLHPTQHAYGFVYQVYKQPKAVLEIVKSVDEYMPGAPIYMVSSGGYHYDPLAERYPNIHFVYDNYNVNLHRGRGNLTVWFDRIKAAALWCNCSYLVLLEDDSILQKPLTDPPPHDAGGVLAHLWISPWPEQLQSTFGASNWSYQSHGMCGGSYIKVSSFLTAYANMNWTRIGTMHEVMDGIGRKNDITIAVMFMDQGYTLKPWEQLTENGKYYNANASIVHQSKMYYNVALSKEDGKVVVEASES